MGENIRVTVSEYDAEKAEQNLKDNTFTDEPEGLTEEEIEALKKDLGEV